MRFAPEKMCLDTTDVAAVGCHGEPAKGGYFCVQRLANPRRMGLLAHARQQSVRLRWNARRPATHGVRARPASVVSLTRFPSRGAARRSPGFGARGQADAAVCRQACVCSRHEDHRMVVYTTINVQPCLVRKSREESWTKRPEHFTTWRCPSTDPGPSLC